MTIDLIEAIQDDQAVASGGFEIAILLTYTLSLQFFEHLVSRALDRAACSNAVIIADPDGYRDALERGIASVRKVGLEYTCVPAPSPGRGIQHAKLALMLGPKRGRLLVGSGNLTHPGFGKNLEVYSRFEFDQEQIDQEAHLAISTSVDLVERLVEEGDFPGTVVRMVEAGTTGADWLRWDVDSPEQFDLWHSLDVSILDQLLSWRERMGLSGSGLKELKIISPYFDNDIETLRRLARSLLPEAISIYVDPENTNLEGERIGEWQAGLEQDIGLFSLQAESDVQRRLHAKAIMGNEGHLTWCIAGSANITRPGLSRSRKDGGNLEIVSMRWTTKPDEFSYLFSEPSIALERIAPESIHPVFEEPSDIRKSENGRLMLTQVECHGKKLEGSAASPDLAMEGKGKLDFLRASHEYEVQLEDDGSFRLDLPEELDRSEAVRLRFQGNSSPYRWIDFPLALQRHGARSYHSRVRTQIETFDGAGKLFEELLNYLWERVDPTEIEERTIKRRRRQDRIESGDSDGEPEEDLGPAPSPDRFITDEEMVEAIQLRIGRHSSPYDRSTLSLRDLLSLALLRVSADTQPATVQDVGTGERDEDEDDRNLAEYEQKRTDVKIRLTKFLRSYCAKYSERLLDGEFPRNTTPILLLENHSILVNVLLEFSAKVEEFSKEDLRRSFWLLWAPLVWPEAVAARGPTTFEMMNKVAEDENIRAEWHRTKMSTDLWHLLAQSFGNPPPPSVGIWETVAVQRFLGIRTLVDRLKEMLGEQNLLPDESEQIDPLVLGPRHSVESEDRFPDSGEETLLIDYARRIMNYIAPTKAKFLPLIQFHETLQSGQIDLGAAINSVEYEAVCDAGLEHELQRYLESPNPILPLVGEDEYCPNCFTRQTSSVLNKIRRGSLELCSASKDCYLYWKPEIPVSVLEL